MSLLKLTLKYYMRWFLRTLRETLDTLDIRNRKTWLGFFITLLGFLFLWQFLGAGPAITEVTTWIIGTVVSGAVLLVAIFLWYFITAPAREDHEKDEVVKQLQNEKRELEAQMEPRLEIFYVEEKSPFKQLTFMQNGDTRIKQTLFRVGVRNLSQSLMIDDVVAKLEQAEPEPLPYLPGALHQMHDEANRLAPQGELFIDIIAVNEFKEDDELRQVPFFYFLNPDIRRSIPMIPYILTLSVGGRNAKGDRRRFRFRKVKNDIRFEAL